MKAVFLILVLGAIAAAGQSIKGDLEAAQKRLVEQRTKNEESQVVLSSKLTALQEEIILKRRQADIARRSISDQRAYANTIQNQALRSSNEAQNLSGSLRTYGIQHHARQLPGTPEDSRLDAIFQEESGDTI